MQTFEVDCFRVDVLVSTAQIQREKRPLFTLLRVVTLCVWVYLPSGIQLFRSVPVLPGVCQITPCPSSDSTSQSHAVICVPWEFPQPSSLCSVMCYTGTENLGNTLLRVTSFMKGYSKICLFLFYKQRVFCLHCVQCLRCPEAVIRFLALGLQIVLPCGCWELSTELQLQPMKGCYKGYKGTIPSRGARGSGLPTPLPRQTFGTYLTHKSSGLLERVGYRQEVVFPCMQGVPSFRSH